MKSSTTRLHGGQAVDARAARVDEVARLHRLREVDRQEQVARRLGALERRLHPLRARQRRHDEHPAERREQPLHPASRGTTAPARRRRCREPRRLARRTEMRSALVASRYGGSSHHTRSGNGRAAKSPGNVKREHRDRSIQRRASATSVAQLVSAMRAARRAYARRGRSRPGPVVNPPGGQVRSRNASHSPSVSARDRRARRARERGPLEQRRKRRRGRLALARRCREPRLDRRQLGERGRDGSGSRPSAGAGAMRHQPSAAASATATTSHRRSAARTRSAAAAGSRGVGERLVQSADRASDATIASVSPPASIAAEQAAELIDGVARGVERHERHAASPQQRRRPRRAARRTPPRAARARCRLPRSSSTWSSPPVTTIRPPPGSASAPAGRRRARRSTSLWAASCAQAVAGSARPRPRSR